MPFNVEGLQSIRVFQHDELCEGMYAYATAFRNFKFFQRCFPFDSKTGRNHSLCYRCLRRVKPFRFDEIYQTPISIWKR